MMCIFLGWTSPIVLPKNESGNISEWIDAALDSKEHPHIVWKQYALDGGPYSKFKGIFYSYWSGNVWTEPIEISHTSFRCDSPSLIIDSLDNVYIFWKEDVKNIPPHYTDIFYSLWDGKEWIAPENIYHTEDLVRTIIGKIKTGIDKEGTIHIFFARLATPIIWIKGKRNSWEAPYTLPESYMTGYLDFLIERDAIHLTYIGVLPDSEGNNDVLYGYFTNGKWSEPIPVHISDGFDTLSFEPQIVKGKDGRLYIFWEENYNGNITYQDILYSYSDNGLSWSEPVNVTHVGNKVIDMTAPSIAVDSKGNIHLAWTEVSSYYAKGYLCYTFWDGNSWGKIDTVSIDPCPPGEGCGCSFDQKLLIDNQNRLHLFWIRNFAGGEDSIFYSSKPIEGIISQRFITNSSRILKISPNPAGW